MDSKPYQEMGLSTQLEVQDHRCECVFTSPPLVFSFSSSSLLTTPTYFQMAVDYAPVDTKITLPDAGTQTLDLQHQLNAFEKYFTTKKIKPINEKDSHIRILGGLGSENTAKPKLVKWKPYEAVFVVAFGSSSLRSQVLQLTYNWYLTANDVALSLSPRIKTSAKSTFLRLALSHTAALQRLYVDGARAFVIPSVLPLQRSPWSLQAVALNKNAQAVDSIQKAVEYWNTDVLNAAKKWCKEHTDVRCLFLDVREYSA